MRDAKGNFIHPTAIIGPNVELGHNNYIGPYCVIGEVAEHSAWLDRPPGYVVIGSNNWFTGLATIDGGTTGCTVIGNNCKLLKHAHVGHDAIIGNGVTISVGSIIGGHAIVCEGANIGLGATIHQKHIVGHYAMIGMNAAVPLKREVKPCTTYAGNPIKELGPNKHAISQHSLSETDIQEFNITYQKIKDGINTTINY